jgi:hypothetical membrane protein
MSTSRATQEHTPLHDTGHPQERPARRLPWSARAGIVGPILFTATYMAQELFRQDEYSPVAEPVSALEAGPNGWVQQANFVVFGLLTLAFAVGLHRGIRPTRAGIVGPALFFVSGIGLMLAGVFPLEEDAAGVTYDPGGHFVAGVMFFGTSAAALITVSPRLARDPRWQGLGMYVRVCGLLAVAGFVLLGVFAIPDDAPLHDWAGLAQRVVILGILFPARIVLALRLSKVAASVGS